MGIGVVGRQGERALAPATVGERPLILEGGAWLLRSACDGIGLGELGAGLDALAPWIIAAALLRALWRRVGGVVGGLARLRVAVLTVALLFGNLSFSGPTPCLQLDEPSFTMRT